MQESDSLLILTILKHDTCMVLYSVLFIWTIHLCLLYKVLANYYHNIIIMHNHIYSHDIAAQIKTLKTVTTSLFMYITNGIDCIECAQ